MNVASIGLVPVLILELRIVIWEGDVVFSAGGR